MKLIVVSGFQKWHGCQESKDDRQLFIIAFVFLTNITRMWFFCQQKSFSTRAQDVNV
uniref:Uncharacterized protein n=1 Tax=Anguilla anguilla TaxID=7936 RepID=A0A0E9XVT5_ANGAN